MKKYFIIHDEINKLYWYGYYSNKYWTDDIRESKTFNNKEEIEGIINDYNEFEGKFLSIIDIYC